MLKYQTGKELPDQEIDLIAAFMNTLTGKNKYME